MKLAIAQINPVIGDFHHNLNRMHHFADQARRAGCDLVVFPELAVCGYPPRDLLDREDFIDANQEALARLTDDLRGIGVICGAVTRNPAPTGKPLFNTAVLFEDGRCIHQSHKQLLPTYDVFDESRHFESGPDSAPVSYKGIRLGISICEDAWNDPDIFSRRFYHTDPVARLAGAGAGLLINISASPFHMGKRAFRWHMYGAIARKYGIPMIDANQVGGNDSLLFEGTSAAFDADGTMVARAADFVEDMITLDAVPGRLRNGEVHPISETEPRSVLNALVMGTRDYVTKCGFSSAVIGLSGGIDSALTAWIAVQALGADHVHTVFMPSAYTSSDNDEDTRRLADHLGVSYDVIPIGNLFDAFKAALGLDGADRRPGITEQNIQARIRGTLLMALSNKTGALVLSTGNKSELAVGYCTLYGDMNGGLAVISDVPKTMVYQLAEEINRDAEVIPDRILQKAPSAELAPDQTDQDDLPPYETLDAILKGYVEEGQSVDDLAAAGFDPDTITGIIQRVDRNEYKRKQAAPGLKVTSKAFGEGRRYPLAKRFVPGHGARTR